MNAGRVFPHSGFDYFVPLLWRLSPPPRMEGHIAFQRQSAVIQSVGDES